MFLKSRNDLRHKLVSQSVIVWVCLYAASLGAAPNASETPIKAQGDEPQQTGLPEVTEHASPGLKKAAAVPHEAGDSPHLRLVITGGLDGGRLGTEGFFENEIFRKQNELPVRIQNPDLVAWRSTEGIFFSDGGRLSKAALVSATTTTPLRQEAQALFGPDLIGMVFTGSEDTTKTYASLQRIMSAVSLRVALEIRKSDDVTIYGFDPSPQTPLRWPTTEDEITATPAAHGVFGSVRQGKLEGVLLARHKGGLDHVMGIVDKRIADDTLPSALYLDVGGALLNAARGGSVEELQRIINRRDPVMLGVGRAELEARTLQTKILSQGPYISPVESRQKDGKNTFPPLTRLVEHAGHRILFVALGGLSKRTTSWLQPTESAMTLRESLNQAAVVANETRPDLILGVTLSDQSASAALSSSLLDGVLHLASSKLSALPAFDDIDFQRNHAAKLHPGPGLIRVSYADVTEVELWLSAEKRLSRTRIRRIPVIDTRERAKDAQTYLSQVRTGKKTVYFPDRNRFNGDSKAWKRDELDRVAGGMVRSFFGTEIAFLPRASSPVPTDGKIPAQLVSTWLPANSSLIHLSVTGSTLKQISAFLGSMDPETQFFTSGADLKGGRVGGRAMYERESYDVTLPISLVRALQAAKISLAVKEKQLAQSRKFGEIFAESLRDADLRTKIVKWLDAPADGVPLHTVFLDFNGLDFGLSFTEVQGTEPLAAIRDARVKTPRNYTIGLNGDVQLVYDGPMLRAKTGMNSQFSRTVTNAPDIAPVIQEPRDQLVFDGDLRLPLARILDSRATWLPQPNMRLTYQTEWTPSQTTKEDGSVEDNARRAELRGLLGAGWDLAPWLPESRLGLFWEQDFATTSASALGWGAEAEMRALWRLGLFSFSLRSLYRGYVPNPGLDNNEDIGSILQTIGSVEVPAFFGLDLALSADSYFIWGRLPETRGPASSLLVSVALKYSGRSKWQPFRQFRPFY